MEKLKIVSGGQTGVDRAALDIALDLNIPCGGWCPKGRIAEDGILSTHYPLDETPHEDYAERTKWNVRDSDATLIFNIGEVTGGTKWTIDFAKELEKNCLVIDLSQAPNKQDFQNWITTSKIKILNIAGPRESKIPDIYDKTKQHLLNLLN